MKIHLCANNHQVAVKVVKRYHVLTVLIVLIVLIGILTVIQASKC